MWKQTNTFAEASKTAVAKGRKWKRYACRIFLCRTFKVFVLFTFALADFCRLVWFTWKSISIKWLEFVALMAYMAYYLLNHKTFYHSSSYIWISRSRKVTQHWESDRESKNLVRSNRFVHYYYVITRHIQDGALQVTKEAPSKCSCHILTGNWTKRQLFTISWG